MILDCKNLACPEPVVRVKNAINSLKIGDKLEILLSSLASKENVSRFLKTNDFEFELSELGGENFKINTIKTANLKDESVDFAVCEATRKKVVFLNEDRCGSGEVGASLLVKFLSSLKNLANAPKMVICVNNAVFMTTNRAHTGFAVLKELEASGVEILSCGSCLEAYKLVDKLAIGRMSNALEIMEILNSNEVINL